jgi:hypothetical protein
MKTTHKQTNRQSSIGAASTRLARGGNKLRFTPSIGEALKPPRAAV